MDTPNWIAWQERGEIYSKLGKWDEAVTDLTKALESGAPGWTIWYERGMSYASLKQWNKAIADFTKAIELKAPGSSVWHQRGQAYAELGEKDKAAADFAQAQRFPDSKKSEGQLTLGRGEAHVRFQRWGEAAVEFARAEKLFPDNYEIWNCEALANLAAGERTAYQQTCARMLERFGRGNDIYAVGKLAYTCVPTPDALADMSVLVSLAEKSVPIFRGNTRIVGAALYRVNKPADALRQFQQSRRNDFVPRAWDWLFLAMIHHRLDNAKEAKQCLKEALRWIEEANQSPTNAEENRAAWGDWTEHQEVEALRKEAEALILGKQVEPKH